MLQKKKKKEKIGEILRELYVDTFKRLNCIV